MVKLTIRLRGHSVRLTEISMHLTGWNLGACFSEVPTLFGPISGATIPFISWQRLGSEPLNFAIFLAFSYVKNMTSWKISFSKQADFSLTTVFFCTRKVPGTFEKQAPGHNYLQRGHLADDGGVKKKRWCAAWKLIKSKNQYCEKYYHITSWFVTIRSTSDHRVSRKLN